MQINRILPVLLLGASLAACTSAPPSDVKAVTATVSDANVKVAPAVVSSVVTVAYASDDQDAAWQGENLTYIDLQGASASVRGVGAAATANTITVLSPGVYVVSGKLNDGQIIVDAQSKGTVRLVLNGADIHSSGLAPVWVKNADKTIMTLAEGTQNAVSDGAGADLSGAGEDDPTAAIFSKDDLTINGTGSLTVRASIKDGVAGKDDVVITGGRIDISAADDGLVARDSLAVKDVKIKIQSGGDGIKTTNDTDPEKGYIALDGGVFDIEAGADGIQAETSVAISGGSYKILTNGGSANGRVVTSNARGAQTTAADSGSAKGIKAKSDIMIGGGTFALDTADDAVHSNNSLTVAGGEISITSGDDGMHADSSLTIKGGKTTIAKSYEGIESKLITISGGETRVNASDDGVNVGGGNDGSAVNGRPGQNSFSASGTAALHIDGGYVAVVANGDGLDANGSITMTNGTVVVSGPTANNNGALDYDGTFEMSGGTLVAAGSSGMMQAPSTQSVQNAIGMIFSSMQQAGTVVSLKDSQGNAVVTYTPGKQFQSVVISSPALKQGDTYTLYTGGTASGIVNDGLLVGEAHQGGTKVVSFGIANAVTWLNESGVTTGNSSPMGGPKRR